jgi:hypothetical protein
MNPVVFVINSPDGAGGEASEAMEHHEAVEMMAAERYLLGELAPELRDAYEDHLFGCTECAADVKLGAVFIDHAREILPEMTAGLPRTEREPVKQAKAKRDWFAWLRPAVQMPGILRPVFMVPAFACLLVLVGYQNLVVLPGLEIAAREPRLLPLATVLQGETRGGVPVVHADLLMGSMISVPLPPGGQTGGYASYRFDFYDAKGKLVWSRTLPVAAADDTASIWIPSRVAPGSYKLAIAGITASGEEIALQQQNFELRLKK